MDESQIAKVDQEDAELGDVSHLEDEKEEEPRASKCSKKGSGKKEKVEPKKRETKAKEKTAPAAAKPAVAKKEAPPKNEAQTKKL